MIPVLCTSGNSIYRRIAIADPYDKHRDARSYTGSSPIVAHPPCRSWSAFCRHQAKPERLEAELGIWCCELLKQNGGVLEQPAWSHLFRAAGLPLPGEAPSNGLFSVRVDQAWFGYPTKKKTWICFAHIDNPLDPPLKLRAGGGDRRRMAVMSKNQRSETVLEMAQWLLQNAMRARKCKQ